MPPTVEIRRQLLVASAMLMAAAGCQSGKDNPLPEICVQAETAFRACGEKQTDEKAKKAFQQSGDATMAAIKDANTPGGQTAVEATCKSWLEGIQKNKDCAATPEPAATAE